LAELEAIKQELITLKQLPERHQYETLSREQEQHLQEMSSRHRDCKHQRHEKRQILAETLTLEAFTLPSNNSTQKVVGMELSDGNSNASRMLCCSRSSS